MATASFNRTPALPSMRRTRTLPRSLASGPAALLLLVLVACDPGLARQGHVLLNDLAGFTLGAAVADVQPFAAAQQMEAVCERYAAMDVCEISRSTPTPLALRVEDGSVVGVSQAYGEEWHNVPLAELLEQQFRHFGEPVHERRDSSYFAVWTTADRTAIRTLLCPDTLSVQGCVTGTEVTTPEDLGVLLAGWDHRPGRFGLPPPTGLREL